METTRMTEAEAITKFVLAGNATFTIVSLKTGTRFTYRVRAKKDGEKFGEAWFVSVLTGNDNENDYTYLGVIFPAHSHVPHVFRHGSKSHLHPVSPSSKAFSWFWRNLTIGACTLPETCEFFHEGRCGRCGRKLTVPESVASGLGPECAARAA